MSSQHTTGLSVARDTRILEAEQRDRERLRIYQSAREAGAQRVLVAIIAAQAREERS